MAAMYKAYCLLAEGDSSSCKKRRDGPRPKGHLFPPVRPIGSSGGSPPGVAEAESLPSGLCLNGRCVEKGCIFPALHGSNGVCAYHALQQLEPLCFCSQQPSSLILERGKIGLMESEFQSDRARDRRQQISQREEFLEVA